MIQKYRRIEDGEFPEMEAYLQTSLTPVNPDSFFVSGLRNRLVNDSNQELDLLLSYQYRLIIFLGTVSIVFLIIAGIRAALTVIASTKGFRNNKRISNFKELMGT